MYKSCLIIATLILTLTAYGQNPDSQKPLTDYQRDSLLVRMQHDIAIIENEIAGLRSGVGRYKVYRTTNIYNSLKLDTASGSITALQIGIDNDKSRFEYLVCDAIETDSNWRFNGRYELYPTGNNHNFILLDTLFGLAYQVQWSTEDDQCGIWRIR